MLKKISIAIIFVFVFFFSFITKVTAQEEFLVDVDVEYKVQESGVTVVTHNITLENKYANLYAKSYSITLNNIDPVNPQAYSGGKKLDLERTDSGDSTTLKIVFDNPVTGKGKFQVFSISFEESSFAIRTGEVWEIAVPRLVDESNFRSYQIRLLVPKNFGKEAFISPAPLNEESSGDYFSYTFNKDSVSQVGITAGFGQFQVFSFTLNYHLENPLAKSALTTISLPPDTAFQKIYYETLDPKPVSVEIDEDGNWIASYKLGSRERIDVVASGAVQIFSTERSFPKPTNETLNKNLLASEFWQTTDPGILALAKDLKTPKAIYDYVSTTLNYDYDRVRPNVDRLGAKEALLSPETAICMEYTDLFIALARAAGIPAREVNGYAYTENPEIQPLSLVADVLHAWPEYYSAERETWIPVDPTWGSTTGGVDFFNKLDLRHFTFVNHGQDPVKPYPPGSYKLGPNPQKDVFVNFGQLPKDGESKPQIFVESQKGLPFLNSKMTISILNPGPTALYNLSPQIFFEGKLAETFSIEALLPFNKYEMKVSVPFSFLGTKTPRTVKVVVAGSTIEVPTYKSQVIVYNLLALFIVLGIIITLAFLKFKKIDVLIPFKKMKAKMSKKNENTKPSQTQNREEDAN